MKKNILQVLKWPLNFEKMFRLVNSIRIGNLVGNEMPLSGNLDRNWQQPCWQGNEKAGALTHSVRNSEQAKTVQEN